MIYMLILGAIVGAAVSFKTHKVFKLAGKYPLSTTVAATSLIVLIAVPSMGNERLAAFAVGVVLAVGLVETIKDRLALGVEP